MAEFILKPNDFQKQVDSFKSTTETVSALKIYIGKKMVLISSIIPIRENTHRLTGMEQLN